MTHPWLPTEPARGRRSRAWFLAHGLPYFVDDIRDLVRRRLTTSRLLVAVAATVLLAVADVARAAAAVVRDRRESFAEILGELEQALRVRVGYLLQK